MKMDPDGGHGVPVGDAPCRTTPLPGYHPPPYPLPAATMPVYTHASRQC